MKVSKSLFLFAPVAALVVLQSGWASTETFSFDSTVGSSITFAGTGTGATFNFPDAPSTPGTDLVIDASSGFGGSLAGFLGDITGTFSFNNSDITGFPGLEAVAVSGTGQFVIHDGSGNDFTATLVWDNLGEIGSVSGLNFTSDVNLSNLSYAGTNADLLALAASSNGSVNVAFSFPGPGMSLDTLGSESCAEGCATSFQGTLSALADPPAATPEPASTSLMLVGGLGIAGLVRRFRKA